MNGLSFLQQTEHIFFLLLIEPDTITLFSLNFFMIINYPNTEGVLYMDIGLTFSYKSSLRFNCSPFLLFRGIQGTFLLLQMEQIITKVTITHIFLAFTLTHYLCDEIPHTSHYVASTFFSASNNMCNKPFWKVFNRKHILGQSNL